MRRILRALPRKRQNLMFSATMPAAIRGLADEVLVEPHVVELGHSRPAETIDHALYPMADAQKYHAPEVPLDTPAFPSPRALRPFRLAPRHILGVHRQLGCLPRR